MKHVKAENWQERAEEAVAGCNKCSGNPPLPDDSTNHPEAQELFDEIEDLIICENAGSRTDWSHYPFYYFELVKSWRSIELELKDRREGRLDMFIKSWFKD